MSAMRAPSSSQVEATAAVVRWYVSTHFRRSGDAGVSEMFCDPARVGAFAVDRDALRSGEGGALFRLLVTTAMFQRRQDVQILRILRGIASREAVELTDSRRLLRLVDSTPCANLQSTALLHGACDLLKDPHTRLGGCTLNAGVACHLKRHTVLLKRYGHFGKVPTSLALILREAQVTSLPELRQQVLAKEEDPLARARALESTLSRAWRVNQKIASMFLSTVTNPDLSPGVTPWAEGVDWTYFVVIDSNVDLFLEAVKYRGGKSYDARREFVRALAQRIDLHKIDKRLTAFNPRLVQQALYLFMSSANRRAAPEDCMRANGAKCRECPPALTQRCPVRSEHGS